jgi:hypothetical protein
MRSGPYPYRYIRFVYCLQQRLDLHLREFLQASVPMGISDEKLLGQMLLDKLPTVKESCLKPDTVKTSENGELRFFEDGGAKIEMPLLRTDSKRLRDLQDTSHCFELLGQVKADYHLSLTAGVSAPKCSFRIRKEHVEKLPLLLDLVNIACEATRGSTEQTLENVCTVPFEPPQPASPSGLACLLLLLEAAASPLQIFGASSCGPRLAVQCLSVRSPAPRFALPCLAL